MPANCASPSLMLFERNQNDGVVYRVVECGVRRFDARVFSANAATDRYGFARNTEAQFTFTGIVTPETGDELERTAAGAYTNARITIHTPFQLSAGDQTQDADIVLWQGRRYTVTG